MIGKKTIGCAIIAIAICWRVFTLDDYFPRSIGDIYYEWALLLPFFSFSLTALVLAVLAVSGNIRGASEWIQFLRSTLFWSFAGVGIAFGVIIGLTAYYSSPQGLFAFLLSDGPLGAAVGILVGLVFWLVQLRSRPEAGGHSTR
jgi:hypothetical protein